MGFTAGTAITAVRGFAADVRPRRKRFEIHAHQRIDRVDQADGIGAAALGRCGDVGHARYVGRELDDHRNVRALPSPTT